MGCWWNCARKRLREEVTKGRGDASNCRALQSLPSLSPFYPKWRRSDREPKAVQGEMASPMSNTQYSSCDAVDRRPRSVVKLNQS